LYGQVYLITNTVNGKRYVGQTIRTLPERWREHIKECPTFPSPINFAIRKHGKEKFTIETLVTAETVEQLNKDEDFYILLLGTIGRNTGYNSRLGGSLGKLSEETKAKISAAHKGKTFSPETLQRMRDAKLGKPISDAHRINIGLAQKGCKRSPEACSNIQKGCIEREARKRLKRQGV
jgi:group I intron endonuclease